MCSRMCELFIPIVCAYDIIYDRNIIMFIVMYSDVNKNPSLFHTTTERPVRFGQTNHLLLSIGYWLKHCIKICIGNEPVAFSVLIKVGDTPGIWERTAKNFRSQPMVPPGEFKKPLYRTLWGPIVSVEWTGTIS